MEPLAAGRDAWNPTMAEIGWREAGGRTPALLSPLRYPGSKRRILAVIRETIETNKLFPGLFVEPFAGGASVSLQLAYEGSVDRIALGDLDPLIAAFWQTVFWDTTWFCDEIDNVEISLDTWHRLRKSKPLGRRDRALKCLFLNRTSFSGIVGGHPGTIGGVKQASKYKIDCRFNRNTIKGRIRRASELASRVAFVRCQRWQQTLRDIDAIAAADQATFLYADPPFMNKARDLYSHYFRPRQHVALRDALVNLKLPWLLSYDADPQAWNLYCSVRGVVQVEHYYSISKASTRQPIWEMLVTNLDRLPSPRPPRLRAAADSSDGVGITKQRHTK